MKGWLIPLLKRDGSVNAYAVIDARDYFARVVVNKKHHVRGYFATPEEAAAIATTLRRELHPCAP